MAKKRALARSTAGANWCYRSSGGWDGSASWGHPERGLIHARKIRPVHGREHPRRPRPRKIFLLLGCVLAMVLGAGLFTSLGSGGKDGPPQVGALAPDFILPRLNGAGKVGQQIGDGRPAVVLFFASWCSICHTELPSLAGVISRQERSTGPLHGIQVLGVDSLDPPNAAEAFVKSAHVVFPTGLDSSSHVLAEQYHFLGPPYAVFVYPDGKIMAIHGSSIGASAFVSIEKRLVEAS